MSYIKYNTFETIRKTFGKNIANLNKILNIDFISLYSYYRMITLEFAIDIENNIIWDYKSKYKIFEVNKLLPDFPYNGKNCTWEINKILTNKNHYEIYLFFKRKVAPL